MSKPLIVTCPHCKVRIRVHTKQSRLHFLCEKCKSRYVITIQEDYKSVMNLGHDPICEYLPSMVEKPIQKRSATPAKQPEKKKQKKQTKLPGQNKQKTIPQQDRDSQNKPENAVVFLGFTNNESRLEDMYIYLSSYYPELLAGSSEQLSHQQILRGLFEKVFTAGINGKYVVSNFMHEEDNGTTSTTIAIRSTVSNFLSSRLPGNQQLRLFGYLGKLGIFYVERVDIVNATTKAVNEIGATFQFSYGRPIKGSRFISNLMEQIPRYTDGTDDELQLWSDYLDWKQKLTTLKICGTKYIAFRLSYDDYGLVGIEFLAAVPDQEEYKRIKHNLERERDIIDEFQDIARQRFNLTKRLSEITKAKVVAVGDRKLMITE